MLHLMLWTGVAQAECHPDALYVEDAEYIDGSCVVPWEYSDIPESERIPETTVEIEPKDLWLMSWQVCAPGSSASAVYFSYGGPGDYFEAVSYWYDLSGVYVGQFADSGSHCCPGQPDQELGTPLTYGVPVQTCYAPVPVTTEEMDLAGNCLDRPGACSTIGTSGVAGVLGVFGGLILLWRRRDV